MSIDYNDTAVVTIRVDVDSLMLCDGEYIEQPLKAGVITKIKLPLGQHLLEFLSEEDPDVKVEKVVDLVETGKSYLVVVNELKAAEAAATNPEGSVNIEQKIYDVLCDIRTELSNLRSEMADVKSELENLQGEDGDKANLYELWDGINDLKSYVDDFKETYEKRMDMVIDENDEGALAAISALHDRLISIELDVCAIKCIIE